MKLISRILNKRVSMSPAMLVALCILIPVLGIYIGYHWFPHLFVPKSLRHWVS